MSVICPNDLNAIRERYCKEPKLNYHARDVMETMDMLCREVLELRHHLDEAHKHIRLLTEDARKWQ